MDVVTLAAAKADAAKKFLATKPVLRLSKPFESASLWAKGPFHYNSIACIQDNITTDDLGNRLAVFWTSGAAPRIGEKVAGQDTWTTFNLSSVSGAPLGTVGNDLHLYMTVARDITGRTHVWGNMHNVALKYARCATAYTIASGWAAGTMIGTEEDSVSYPTPVMDNVTKELHFFYRNGGSGNGDWYWNKLSNAAAGTWTRVGKLCDGISSSDSMYVNHIAPARGGGWHVFYVWRTTTDPNTNNDLCYVRLYADGTAKKHDGTTQTLPLTHANADIILDTAATGSGLLNSQGACEDTQGRPHAAQWIKDGSGFTQLVHWWIDNGVVNSETLTRFTKTYNYSTTPFVFGLSRGSVVCTASGRTFIIYTAKSDGKKGYVRAIDCTPGGTKAEFKLMDLDMGDWEPTYDTRALIERDQLNMVCIASASDDQSPQYVSATHWDFIPFLVLEADLAKLGLIQGEALPRPRIRPIASAAQSVTPLSITATSYTSIGVPILHVKARQAGETLYVRVSGKGNVSASGTTLNLAITEKSSLAGAIQRGIVTISTVTTSYFAHDGRWIPLRTFAVDDYGEVRVEALKAGTGTGNLENVVLELGVLEGVEYAP